MRSGVSHRRTNVNLLDLPAAETVQFRVSSSSSIFFFFCCYLRTAHISRYRVPWRNAELCPGVRKHNAASVFTPSLNTTWRLHSLMKCSQFSVSGSQNPQHARRCSSALTAEPRARPCIYLHPAAGKHGCGFFFTTIFNFGNTLYLLPGPCEEVGFELE